MTDLPAGPFGAIYADPAWEFRTRSDKGHGKSPQRHYPCMSPLEIAELPVGDLAAEDCALFLWATFPLLPTALWVMQRWGFIYKTGGAWGKRSSTGRSWAFGPGYIFRGCTEILLVGTRGAPTWRSHAERNLWIAAVREHSRKPDCIAEMIERTASGPFLEMFATTERPGWSYWAPMAHAWRGDHESVDEN